MSFKKAASAGAVLQRRNEWVSSLRESLPHFAESTASPLQNGSRAAVFGQGKRHVLDDAVRASLLLLPSGWKDDATRRLAQTLHGIVEPQALRECDYFLCSLIHPTYVQAATVPHEGEARLRKLQQQLRRTVCMPLELTMAGSKSLRLIREVNGVVESGLSTSSGRRAAAAAEDEGRRTRRNGSGPSVGSYHQLDAPWPELSMANTNACLASLRQSELEALVLFDKASFPPSPSGTAVEGGDAAIPVEVSLSAFTALCGSVELVCGWTSLVHFLDRVAREQGGVSGRRAL